MTSARPARRLPALPVGGVVVVRPPGTDAGGGPARTARLSTPSPEQAGVDLDAGAYTAVMRAETQGTRTGNGTGSTAPTASTGSTGSTASNTAGNGQAGAGATREDTRPPMTSTVELDELEQLLGRIEERVLIELERRGGRFAGYF